MDFMQITRFGHAAVLVEAADTRILIDPGVFSPDDAFGLDGLETVVVGITIRGVGSQHAVIVPALPRVANVGVVLTADGEPTLFHPGDTYEYAPDRVDVLALPLSAPWAKVSETVDFVQRVSPTTLFPVHDCTVAAAAYGIYWKHVLDFGGTEDSRRLGQTDSTRA